jgi:hypothetical protein
MTRGALDVTRFKNFNRAWALGAVLFVVAAFCNATADSATTTDETVLAIDAGRLLAMLDQVSVLLNVENPDEEAGDSAAVELVSAVHRYAVLRAVACERDVIDASQCSMPGLPAPQPGLSGAALRDALDSAEAHIHPLWETVCKRLDKPAHPVCQME